MSEDNETDALKNEGEAETCTETERKVVVGGKGGGSGWRVSSHRMHNGASNETGMSIDPVSSAWNTKTCCV